VLGGAELDGHAGQFRRDRGEFFVRLHDELGDVGVMKVFRYPVLSIASPDLLHEVFVEKARSFEKTLSLRIAFVLLTLLLVPTAVAQNDGGDHKNYLIIVRTPYEYDRDLFKDVSSWHASLLASVCDMAEEELDKDPSAMARLIYSYRHVVNGCQSVSVRADSSTGFKAQVVALHAHDDLAVIRADATFGGVAAFRVGAAIRPGDDIVAVGFPLAGLLADEPSVTTGSVSALAGIHNDPAILQMSAPVQQGSSGGPLFDASGNVVGIVVTKLNARVVAEETGDDRKAVSY